MVGFCEEIMWGGKRGFERILIKNYLFLGLKRVGCLLVPGLIAPNVSLRLSEPNECSVNNLDTMLNKLT